ncbi:MAG: protein kinase [bacterium]|nr:protein kinase [bacterium]
MARVYLARQIKTSRLVAVKILKDVALYDDDYVKRFFREARIMAKLDHPHILAILESNYTGGQFYIVTEYIDGGALKELVINAKVSLHRKLEIINKVIDALDYAHGEGIVHRDIKPSNILLSKKLEPKLCDFGIATALWGQESRYTQTNDSIGTMDYIAPEQKENSKNVDFRADIYSMGVILYQLITGIKPMGAFAPAIELTPAIPPLLDACIMKCLQPVPYRRHKSTRNLYNEITESIALLKAPPTHEIIKKTVKVTKPPLREIPTVKITEIIPAKRDDTAKTAGTIHTAHTKQTKKTTHTKHTSAPAGPAAPVDSSDAPETQGTAPKEITDLIGKLKNGSLTQKLSSKSRLIDDIGPEHETMLVDLLADSEGFLKETVIEALGKIKSKESCPHLIELLNDPYYNKLAATAIGEIGCEEAEYKLFNILVSNNAYSYVALLPLGKLNSLKSVKTMATFLKNPHDWIREMALDALAMITGDERIVDYFEKVSRQDKEAHIRAKAKKLLWRFNK